MLKTTYLPDIVCDVLSGEVLEATVEELVPLGIRVNGGVKRGQVVAG